MKNNKIYLVAVLFLVMVLHFSIIQWGLPHQSRIYTWNGDETTYLSFLGNMNPSELDFDPKLYWKTHFSIYYTGIALKVGELIGLYRIGDRNYYKANPNEFRKVLLWLRISFGKAPVFFLVLVSFFLGRMLLDDRFGLILAAVSGFLPTVLVNGNYCVENILITLFIVLVFFFSMKFYITLKPKYLMWAGALVGLAISTKQTGIISFGFVVIVLWIKRKIITWKKFGQFLILSSLFAILVFALTSPYYLKFIILRIFSPAEIPKDFYGSTNIPTDIFNLDWQFFIKNIWRIVRVSFIQTGGFLFLLIPVGIHAAWKNNAFKVVLFYCLMFFLVSTPIVYSSDSRLIPLAYFLALLGLFGGYQYFMRGQRTAMRCVVSTFIILSLILYAGTIVYRYLREDNRFVASRWLEKHALYKKDVSIGLHEIPTYGMADIITMEFRHYTPGNSHFYPDRYMERFIVAENKFGNLGDRVLLIPREIMSRKEKMKWLEGQSPEYIVLAHDLFDWPDYFKRSENYQLVKFFPKFNLLGAANLAVCSFDIYIFKKRLSSAEIQSK